MPASSQPTPLRPRYAVSTSLTQNYRMASAVSAEAQVAAGLDANGKLQLFTIGTQGSVFNFFQEGAGEAGWKMADMNFPGKAKLIAAGREADGTPLVVACRSDDQLFYIRDLRWSGGWTAFGNRSIYHSARSLRITSDKEGKPLVTLCASQDGFWYVCWADLTPGQTWKTLNDRDAFEYEQVFDYQIGLDQTAVSVPASNGVSVFCSALQYSAQNGFQPVAKAAPWAFGRTAVPSYYAVAAPSFASLAATPDPGRAGNTALFGIEATSRFPYQLKYDRSSHGNVQIESSQQLTTLAASSTPAGRLQVFGITAGKGALYHVEQDPSRPSGWGDGVIVFDAATVLALRVVRDAAGVPHAFLVSTDGRLFNVWQDPGDHEWKDEEIEVDLGTAERYDSYQTTLTVLDEAGAPRGNEPVTLGCDDPIVLTVNGASFHVDADTPWSGKTNLTGEITFSTATETLGTQILEAGSAALPAGEVIRIDPAGAVKDRLAAISADALLAARCTEDDGSSRPLLTGAGRDADVAGALAKASRKAMSLGTKPPARGRSGMLHPRTDPRVAWHAVRDGRSPNRIDVSAVPEQHWRLEFGTGKVWFTELSRDQASVLLAERRASVRGIPAPWDVDWGDVWQSVKEGVGAVVSDVKDIVISTIVDQVTGLVDKVTAQLRVLIGGLEYLWEGAVDFVQQVFDVVEAAFRKVQVAFDDLFRWLGVVFDKDNILRTKAALDYTFDVVLNFLASELTYVEGRWDQWIASARTQVRAAFSGATPITLDQAIAVPAVQQKEPPATGSNNPFLKALADNLSSITFAAGAPPLGGRTGNGRAARAGGGNGRPAAGDGGANPVAAWSALSPSILGSSAGKAAESFFSSVGANEAIAYQQPLQPLYGAAAGVADLLLAGMSGAVSQTLSWAASGLTAFRDAARTDIEIPVLSPIYQVFTGARVALKPIDVVTLVLAFEGNLAYSAAKKTAPFPDAASLQRFKAAFNVQTISAVLNGRRAELSEALGDELEVIETILQVLNGMVELFPVSVLEAFSDLATVGKFGVAVPQPVSIMLAAVEWVQAGLSVPWPFSTEPPGVSNPDALRGLIWIADVVLHPVLDTAWLVVAGKLPKLDETFGIPIAMATSAVDLGLYIWLAVLEGGDVDPLETTSNVVSTLPGLGKFLRIEKLVLASEGVSLGVLVGVDLVAHGFVGTAGIISALNPQLGRQARRARQAAVPPEPPALAPPPAFAMPSVEPYGQEPAPPLA